ncbi:MAG: hypothetical protein Tsb0014_30820 [Pleurocapsa sp.]
MSDIQQNKYPLTGKTIYNRFDIKSGLGRGNFGTTYIAEDRQNHNRKCIVKQFTHQSYNQKQLETARRLFTTEALVLEKLGKHAQIPEFIASFEEEGQFFIVQELIEGKDLKEEFASGKKFSELETINLIKDVLYVLIHVHETNCIHRDIKPSNLIRPNRTNSKINLIDFGAVKEKIQVDNFDNRGHSILTVTVGTPGYMPKEQKLGRPKFCSDLYAVGILAIAALTGISASKIPLDEEQNDTPIWRNLLPNNVDYNPHFLNFIDRLVAGNWKDRYQSADEAYANLKKLPDSSVKILPETELETALIPPKSHKKFIAILSCLGLSIVAIPAWLLLNPTSTNWQAYDDNSQLGIKVDYPENWLPQTNNHVFQQAVTFISPDENDSDSYQEQVKISIQKSPPLSLSEYSQRSVEEIEKASNDIVSPLKDTTLAARSAKTITYQRQEGNLTIKRKEVWTLKNNKVYNIIYIAEADKYDKFYPQAEKIIQSFEIVE